MELMIVGVVAVLLFGSQLPAVARSAGKSLTELKRGMRDAQDEFRRTMDEVDHEATAASAKQLAAPAGDANPDYPESVEEADADRRQEG